MIKKKKPQNRIEKIVQRFADEKTDLTTEDYVTITPMHVLTHDNSSAVMKIFAQYDKATVKNPNQLVFALDHNIQDTSNTTKAKYASIAAFAAEHAIDFYPAGRGIGHQIMIEEGYTWPNTFVTASDSHANIYGGLGCLGTPIVRTDAANIWATGKMWWQIPPVTKVELNGQLLPGVTGKDLIMTLCEVFNTDQVLNHAIEFCGRGVESLSINQRLSVANMTTEWGAIAGLFPVDDVLVRWLEDQLSQNASDFPRFHRDKINRLTVDRIGSDPGAFYNQHIVIDLETVQPIVLGPDNIKIGTPVVSIREKKISIQKAYLLSCVNARVEDFAEAAKILAGQKINPNVEFYIGASSQVVQKECEQQGIWQELINAGARILPPGCGPCIGLGEGVLEDGQVAVSATNRNFRGRMGSRDAHVYLASPAVVAQSALSGFIDSPNHHGGKGGRPVATLITQKNKDYHHTVDVIDSFPARVNGPMLLCLHDNITTDAIYPGKYTYIDSMTPEQQAGVVMENYDPSFSSIVKAGDILITGYNFGTGSSREQAVTALQYSGVKLVIAGSFSQTYSRNALNNGFIILTSSEFVNFIRAKCHDPGLTIRIEGEIAIDFQESKILYESDSFRFTPLGMLAQKLIVAGGIVNFSKMDNLLFQ